MNYQLIDSVECILFLKSKSINPPERWHRFFFIFKIHRTFENVYNKIWEKVSISGKKFTKGSYLRATSSAEGVRSVNWTLTQKSRLELDMGFPNINKYRPLMAPIWFEDWPTRQNRDR